MGSWLSQAGTVIIQSKNTLVTSLIAVNLAATRRFAPVGAASTVVSATESMEDVPMPSGKTISVSRLYGRLESVSTKNLTFTLRKNGVDTALTVTVNAGLVYFEIASIGGIQYSATDKWSLSVNTNTGNDNARTAYVYFDFVEI